MIDLDALTQDQYAALETMAKSIQYDLDNFLGFLHVFMFAPKMFGGALASKLQEAHNMLKAESN